VAAGRSQVADVKTTVLVTGAASGIGRAACERLSRNGWNVLAVDRDARKLDWAAAAGIKSVVADVASEEDNHRMVAEAIRCFGGLNAAILNAAVTGGGGIEALPFASFRQVIEVNLFGTVLGIRAVLPALRQQGGGAIAVTSSTAGLAGDAENWAYSASKHALLGVVRSVAREVGWEGIRINALCPGPTETGMTSGLKEAAPTHYEALRRAVPLQRWAAPDEMASVLEFLISPAASYVSGHALVADGGTMVGTGLVAPKAGTANAIPANINH
jgi:meso-butanediol dehydrogenase / (S,S)-butanediol dehydrogenase / diacetyl reductase